MKLSRYFGNYLICLLGLAACLTVAVPAAEAANVTVAVNAGGDNTCSGPASFAPTEVPVHEGDNVTLIFSVGESEDWSISTYNYSQWGTLLVPAGQSRTVSFVAPGSSFSYYGSWSRNGCYRTSGVVRVTPLPKPGPPPPPPDVVTPPEAPEGRTTFGATPATSTPTRSSQTDDEPATNSGQQPAPEAAVTGPLDAEDSDKVTPVTIVDFALVAGCVFVAGLCIGGLVLLRKHKMVS